jgi:hypothetical protein
MEGGGAISPFCFHAISMAGKLLCVKGLYLLLLQIVIASAAAAKEPVPKVMLGEWAKNGRCDLPSDRLLVTDTTVSLGTGEPRKVVYSSHDGPGGRGALRWEEEGVVANMRPRLMSSR